MLVFNANVFFLSVLAIAPVLPYDGWYRAAVVEFAPLVNNVTGNTDRFIDLIQQASSNGSDIIVFPEIGLNGYGECSEDMLTQVPHPATKTAPYLDNNEDRYSQAFKRLSEAAFKEKIYVVINLAEIVPCTNEAGCPSNGRFRYNTNVALDRTGVVIARYRKFNLFGEKGTNVTKDAEISFFDTDFGVRFGMFICFDLMFDKPTNQLVKQLGIRDFVFSTAWFSELPYLTAVQAQHMWSYSQDVNFLGSGYNMPSVGSGGSGIFLGRNSNVMEFPDETTTKLIIADVPMQQFSKKSLDNQVRVQNNQLLSIPIEETMKLKKENLTAYVTKSLTSFNSSRVCHGQFCCDFSIELTNAGIYAPPYRALVFDGVRTFDGLRTGGVQTCAIAYCQYDTLDGCAERGFPDFDVKFIQINITGTFDVTNALPMPSTLRDQDQLLPFSNDDFSFDQECSEASCNITMQLKKPTMQLKTFGVYSRNFRRDGEPVTLPSASDSSTQMPFIPIFLISFTSFIASKF